MLQKRREEKRREEKKNLPERRRAPAPRLARAVWPAALVIACCLLVGQRARAQEQTVCPDVPRIPVDLAWYNMYWPHADRGGPDELGENECAVQVPLENIAQMFDRELGRRIQERFGTHYIDIHFPHRAICFISGDYVWEDGELHYRREPCYDKDNSVNNPCCMIYDHRGTCIAPAEGCGLPGIG